MSRQPIARCCRGGIVEGGRIRRVSRPLFLVVGCAFLLAAFGAAPLLAACGDSLLDPGEQCDDGNTAHGDGCSQMCRIETGWACSEPVPAQPGTNVVPDAGFESGTPNPFWNEISTNFGTPLCTLANCGDDGGSGSQSGLWWAWFGGVGGDFEEASVTQNVVIPSTATTLDFGLEQILCDSADDFLEVTIDLTQVFVSDGASPLCGVLGYNSQSIDISAWADGGTYPLKFRAQTFSTSGGVTDFFVDDVVISDNVPLPPQPSECSPTLNLTCNGPSFDFDNPVAGIPLGWTVVNNVVGGLVWTDVGGAGETGNYTGGGGEAATASSDAFGAGEFDTELRTAPFDLPMLPGGEVAWLQYLASYENFFNRDLLDVDISTDGGIFWTTLLSWNEDHGDFREPPGEAVTIDLSPYLGLPGLLLRWRYYDPNPDLAWYAQIDNVALFCGTVTGAGRVPDGKQVPGTPLSLNPGPAADTLTLRWSSSCSTGDSNYAIYSGTLGSFASHEPVVCSTGGAMQFTIPLESGNRYYLVVPRTGEVEGSHGARGDGQPRPVGTKTCLPQVVADCD